MVICKKDEKAFISIESQRSNYITFVQLLTFLLCHTYCEPASPGVERVSVLIGRASSGSQESSLAEVASCPLFSNIENITFISVYCGTCHPRWIIDCHNCTLLQGESLKRRWLPRSRRWGLKVFCHFFVKIYLRWKKFLCSMLVGGKYGWKAQKTIRDGLKMSRFHNWLCFPIFHWTN